MTGGPPGDGGNVSPEGEEGEEAAALRLCLITAELAPFAKTGGLGDVCAALTRYLHGAGHDVRAFVPLYAKIDRGDHHFVAVEFLRNVPLALGPWELEFTVYTAAHPGAPSLGLYFIDCPALYGDGSFYTGTQEDALRFAFLGRAALTCCQRMGWSPEIVHCHDWHTALVPLDLRTLFSWDRLFAQTRTVLTLHNVGYQGVFGSQQLLARLGLESVAAKLHQEDLQVGRLNFLKTGLLYADLLTTVSRTHALEIQTQRYGMGLEEMLRARSDHLIGIVNGVDYEEWNPATDPHLPVHYDAEDPSNKGQVKQHLMAGMGISGDASTPLVGIVSRLTSQKGFDLCFEVLPELLRRRPQLRLVVLGSGERRYEEFFLSLEATYRGRVGFYRGYNNPLAHLIEAGSDIFVMPSLYEPCGLNQMYSQRYGTVPVVRRTGGLADTVEPFDPATGRGTGFVFDHFTPQGLQWALQRALDTFAEPALWSRLIANGMGRDFSWEKQIERYVALYRTLTTGIR